MKYVIGVISDTHSKTAEDLDPRLLDALAETYTVFHLGDIVSMDVIYELERYTDVIAVSGNMDALDVRMQLPSRRVVTIAGVKFALTHGWGAPYDLPERVYALLFVKQPQIILFGHSHIPYMEEKEGILLFNPGAAKDGHYGIIEVEDGKILKAEHKKL